MEFCLFKMETTHQILFILQNKFESELYIYSMLNMLTVLILSLTQFGMRKVSWKSHEIVYFCVIHFIKPDTFVAHSFEIWMSF